MLNDDIQLVVFEKDDKGLKEDQTGAVQLKDEPLKIHIDESIKIRRNIRRFRE